MFLNVVLGDFNIFLKGYENELLGGI